MTERLTLATSSGMPLLFLAFHVAMGTAALTAGLIAIAARKGGKWHRRSGQVFVVAMIAMALSAAGISIYEGKPPGSGLVTAYLIITAFTAVRPLPTVGRGVDIALMALAITFAVPMYLHAFTALDMPGNRLDGVPAGMLFFLATVFSLAAIGDARMVWAGGIQGTRRLARHLWRMCFGLFIAAGSFAAPQVGLKFHTEALRSFTVILILAAGPLVVLLYWMWRVRLKQNLRGVMTTKPIEAN